MPAKGSQLRDEEYEITLIGLEEIISRYKATPQIIIAGDFNASLKTDAPDARDKKFKQFTENHKLSISHGHPNIPTYIKPNGMDCSHLDYILVTSGVKTKNTKVKQLVTNTSDHRPVHAELLDTDLTPSTEEQLSAEPTSPGRRKPKGWDKIDTSVYQALTGEEIEKIPLFDKPCSDWEATTTLRKITEILIKCKDKLTPIKLSSSRKGRKNLPRQIRWTPEIKIALAHKKKVFSLWKKAGRPRDVNHPLFKANREAKKNFRRVQRAKKRC